MFAFDVRVNQSLWCCAGMGPYGVLSVLLHVPFRSAPAPSSPSGPDPCFTTLEVGGLTMASPGHRMSWILERLPSDAELVVRLVHRDEVDPPISVTPWADARAAGSHRVDVPGAQAPGFADAGRGGVEVFVNGSKRCRAALHGERGVVAALMWTCRSPENRAELFALGHSDVGDELCVCVMGDAPDGSFKTWLREPLVVGDEVRFRLVG